jgi:hypothetical protein
MTRKTAEHWWNLSARIAGQPPVLIPPDVAYYKLYGINHEKEPVTWSQVMESRRQKQKTELSRKLVATRIERPALLEIVKYNPDGRWYIYLKTISREYDMITHDRNLSQTLLRTCYDLFPLGTDDYNTWCEAFYRERQTPVTVQYSKRATAKIRIIIQSHDVTQILRS